LRGARRRPRLEIRTIVKTRRFAECDRTTRESGEGIVNYPDEVVRVGAPTSRVVGVFYSTQLTRQGIESSVTKYDLREQNMYSHLGWEKKLKNRPESDLQLEEANPALRTIRK
jgi:hypothetical protein